MIRLFFLLFLVGCGGGAFVTESDLLSKAPFSLKNRQLVVCIEQAYELKTGKIILEYACLELVGKKAKTYVLTLKQWHGIKGSFSYYSDKQIALILSDLDFIKQKTNFFDNKEPESLEELKGFIYDRK